MASNRWYVTVRCPPAWARQRSSAQLPAGAEPDSFLQTKGPYITTHLISKSNHTPTSRTHASVCDLCFAKHFGKGMAVIVRMCTGQAGFCGFQGPNARRIFICTVCNSEHSQRVQAFRKRLLPSLALFLKSLTSSTPPLSSMQKKKQHVI